MNFLNFEKILYHPDNIIAFKNDIPVFPVHATLSLGNICNHKCLWCTAYQYQKENYKLIELDPLLEFLKKARSRGLKAVTYVGNGEPTIHPQFGTLIDEVADLDIEQGMFTNGYLLNKLSIDSLSSFVWIRFSLDAGSSAVHETVHNVRGQFPIIISNIKNLVASRTRQSPTIGVQYAVHHKNFEDLHACAQLVRDIGVDYFSIKPVFNRGSVGKRVEKNLLSHHELDPVAEKIKAEFTTADFQVFYRPHQILSHENEKNTLSYQTCGAGFFNINIYEDGNIIYCGPNRVGVGQITDSLDQIQQRIVDLRNKLDLRKCPAGCRYHELNHLLDSIINPEKISRKTHLNFI